MTQVIDNTKTQTAEVLKVSAEEQLAAVETTPETNRAIARFIRALREAYTLRNAALPGYLEENKEDERIVNFYKFLTLLVELDELTFYDFYLSLDTDSNDMDYIHQLLVGRTNLIEYFTKLKTRILQYRQNPKIYS